MPARQPTAEPPAPHLRTRLIAALLAALCAFTGCASMTPDAAPLVWDHEAEPDLVTNFFPPLFSGVIEKPISDEAHGFGLWPLYHYQRRGRETYLGLLGMDFYRRRIDHRGFEKVDAIYGPIITGHSADQGSYLLVLPFGGTTKGLLGKSYALWVLFPFYLYTEDNRGVGPAPDADVFVSQHVLFPFINWVSGHGREGFRVFPFYAHYARKNLEGTLEYDRTWILFPFFTVQHNNMATSLGPAGEQYMWFLMPFFGYEKGPTTKQYTVLWPFFRYFETTSPIYGGPGWQLHFYPFVTLEEQRFRSRFDVWPLYGHKERVVPMFTGKNGFDAFERTFLLWPILRWETHETETYLDRKQWAAPIYWHFDRVDKATGAESEQWKVWPLFRYMKREDGRESVNILSPLWFKDPEGGFEKIYNPLTRIYEYGKTPEGDTRRLFAWGLVQHYDNARSSETWVHPLLYWNHVDKDDANRDDSFLFGLFQIHHRGREHALRFFWLPEFPTWTSDDDGRGPRGKTR